MALGLVLALALSVQAQQATVELRDFTGGLNDSEPPLYIKDNESPNLQNWLVDEQPGALTKRNGNVEVFRLPSGLIPNFIGTYIDKSNNQYMALGDGANLYFTQDFSTFTWAVSTLTATAQLDCTTARGEYWCTNGTDGVFTWNATSITWLMGNNVNVANAPKGEFIEFEAERVWIAKVSASKSSVFFTSLIDNTGTTLALTSTSAWVAANEIQCGRDDGDQIYGLKGYRGQVYPFKDKSLWRVNGTDELSFGCHRILRDVGSRSDGSIAEAHGLLKFVGKNGIYDFNGDTAVNKYDKIRGTFALIQQPLLNRKQQTWDTQVQFNASGAVASPDVNISTALSAGDIIGSTFTNLQTSQADWQAAVSSTSVDMTTTAGSVVLVTTNPIVNPSLETSSGAGWTIGTGWSVVSGNANVGTYSFKVTNSGNVLIRVIEGSSTYCNQWAGSDSVYHVVTCSGLEAQGAAVGDSISITVYDLSVTDARSVTQLFTYLGGNLTVYVKCSGVGGSICYVDDFSVANYAQTGNFTTQGFSLGTSSPAIVLINPDIIYQVGTNITYQIQFATDAATTATWSSLTTISSGVSVAGNNGQGYGRVKATLTHTVGSLTPQLNALSTIVLTTGTFTSESNCPSSFSSWGRFLCEKTANSGSLTFEIRLATGSTALSTNGTYTTAVCGQTVSTITAYVCMDWRGTWSAPAAGGFDIRGAYLNEVIVEYNQGGSTNLLPRAIFWDNRYLISIATTSDLNKSKMLYQAQPPSEGSVFMPMVGMDVVGMTIFEDNLYGISSTTNTIFRMDFGNSDLNSTAINAIWDSKEIVFGLPDNYKSLRELDLDYQRDGSAGTITLGRSRNGGTSYISQTVYLNALSADGTTSGRFRKILNIADFGLNFRFRISNSELDINPTVYGITAFALPQGVRR